MMLYRPQDPSVLLWDTWIYHHDGTYHLFHLTRDEGKAWDRIGHAVSNDLLSWSPAEDIVIQEPEGWDSGPTLTGMVIPHGDGFVMTYGSVVDRVERIGLMFSKDLYSWTKHPDNPVLLAKLPHYEDDPSDMALPSVAWRDAFVQWLHDADCYEAIVSARVPEGDLMRRGCIARVRSKDLIHWEHLPPIAAPMLWQDMEVPERFFLNGRYYLIFSTADFKGPDLSSPRRSRCSGTFYMVSDNRDQGYELTDDPLLLGSGEGRWDNYVGRYVNFNGTPLLYYHQCGPRPALALPKEIHSDQQGRLSLRYWKQSDSLRGERIHLGTLPGTPLKTGARAHGSWSADGPKITGDCSYGSTSSLLEATVSNFHWSCSVSLASAQKAGLIFRYDPQNGAAFAVVLDQDLGGVVIGRARRVHAGVIKIDPLDICLTSLCTDKPHDLIVIANEEFVDVFVDDFLIFSSVLDGGPTSGRIGFHVDTGEAIFKEVGLYNFKLP